MSSETDSYMVPQPEGLKINLYKHQLASIYRMEALEKTKQVKVGSSILETTLGINGDIAGYGKTLAMVGLLVRDKMEWDTTRLHKPVYRNCEAAGLITRVRTSPPRPKVSCNLILVPATVVKQWEAEFAYSSLSLRVVNTKKKIAETVPEDWDAILVVPTMFKAFMELHGRRRVWKRFIFDEPGQFRVPHMPEVRAGFTWLISATPRDIYPKQAWGRGYMSDVVRCTSRDFEKYCGGIIIRNTPESIAESFSMPETRHHHHYCLQPLYRAMMGLVDHRVEEMLSAGNVGGAIDALGGESTDNILDVVRQTKLEELDRIEASIRIYTRRNDPERLAEWRGKEERVKEQLRALEERFKGVEEADCSICMDTLKEPVMEPGCQNLFCGNCLLEWLKHNHKCPMCRQRVEFSSLVHVSTTEKKKEEGGKEEEVVTKPEKVVRLISGKKDGQFLIFTCWDETFPAIKAALNKKKISFEECKGSSDQRGACIRRFRSGKNRVLFLNAKNNGAGSNLQEATDVIFYHEMSDTLSSQALGRALRIGRKVPLDVHHLI